MFSLGRLGDVFISIPVLEALKDTYPDSNITVVTDPGSARAISPACTRYTPFPSKRISGFNLKMIAFNLYNIYTLRKRKLDLSDDFYGGGSSPHHMSTGWCALVSSV